MREVKKELAADNRPRLRIVSQTDDPWDDVDEETANLEKRLVWLLQSRGLKDAAREQMVDNIVDGGMIDPTYEKFPIAFYQYDEIFNDLPEEYRKTKIAFQKYLLFNHLRMMDDDNPYMEHYPDDAAEVILLPLDELADVNLAFDHRKIINHALLLLEK